MAFGLGVIALPFGLWVRRGLPETLHETEAAAVAVTTAPTRLGAVVEHWPVLVLGLAILAAGTIRTYVTHSMTTFAQDTLHIAAGPAFAVAVVSSVTGLAGVLYGGRLSDRIGRRPVMIRFNGAVLLLAYPVFVWIVQARSATALLTGMGVLGLVGVIHNSGFYAALTESLHKAIRGGAFATV